MSLMLPAGGLAPGSVGAASHMYKSTQLSTAGA